MPGPEVKGAEIGMKCSSSEFMINRKQKATAGEMFYRTTDHLIFTEVDQQMPISVA
jgi:hypothetical protein